MYQGTTPALIFRVKDRDLTDKTVFISIKTGTHVVTKTGSDVAMVKDDDDTILTCTLTQNETLRLDAGDALAQIRFIDENGAAASTNKAKLTVQDVLYKDIIRYAEDEGT